MVIFCQKIVFLCQLNAFLNIKLQKNGQFLSKIVILCQNGVIFCQNFNRKPKFGIKALFSPTRQNMKKIGVLKKFKVLKEDI